MDSWINEGNEKESSPVSAIYSLPTSAGVIRFFFNFLRLLFEIIAFSENIPIETNILKFSYKQYFKNPSDCAPFLYKKWLKDSLKISLF